MFDNYSVVSMINQQKKLKYIYNFKILNIKKILVQVKNNYQKLCII